MSPPAAGPAFDALRAIGWPFADAEAVEPAWRDAFDAHPGTFPARVVEQHRTGYLVARAPGDAMAVESPPEWQLPRFAPEQRAAVGDWVLVGDGRIVALLARRTVIKRGAAGEHYRQQLIAANVDRVLIVSGLDGDFNPRRIERYLLLVRGGAEPLVVLTKADRAATSVADAQAALAAVVGDAVPVVAVNARDPESVAALAPWLGPGTTAVLVGSSGAGKSTVTNTLLGHERMRTRAVRAGDDRGRHTTTHRALIPLPSGACLIDTPGMRELKPTGEEHLGDNFADVEALAAQCRFRDCSHANEPGCAVRAAVQAGILEPARFANYLKLREELAAAARQLEARRRAPNPPPGGRRRR
ncbi:ribosome small subunit-dependent GTPase A [Luteimonas abyssi]|uniref:ribosome small subunit-dependent GTPase A n=1 Tax=Luteimonas abyssi TaxID=1247514 RepID=UPI000737C98E|nr:ribosome small subunit-dependent GTPase A [Luteimonas abyssi]